MNFWFKFSFLLLASDVPKYFFRLAALTLSFLDSYRSSVGCLLVQASVSRATPRAIGTLVSNTTPSQTPTGCPRRPVCRLSQWGSCSGRGVNARLDWSHGS